MLELGTKVMVLGGINLYDLDSNARVIATQDVINSANKIGVVKAVDGDLVLLDGIPYEFDSEVWFSQEWLVPADEDYEFTCSVCGKKIKYEDATFKGGKCYCEECVQNIPLCDKCGNATEELFDTIDGKLCARCIGSYNQHSYDYSPTWKHRYVNEDDHSLLIGAEIEIDNGRYKDATRKKITEVMGQSCVYENDGSLDDGIEIVTHPFSFNFWENKVEYISRMFDVAQSNGWKSHDTRTCGLHLHVNKNDLSTEERSTDDVIDNILLITETFMNELIKFSRRHETHYAKFLQDIVSERRDIAMSYIRRNKDSGREKYRALNIDHRNTIEFRMFRGTLNIKTFMATIELVNNIVEIAKYSDIEGLTWDGIISYNSDKTHYIKEYNESRGISSDKCVHLLSEIEVNRDNFSIEKFINGSFGVDTNTLDTNDTHFMLGVLRALNVVSNEDRIVSFDDIVDCKIKVRNNKLIRNARTNIQDGEDIIELWQNY